MLDPRQHDAPGRRTEGEGNYEAAGRPITTIPASHDPRKADPPVPTLAAQDAVNRVRGAYVLVIYSPRNGRFHRRVLFNLPAAQAAVERAEHRGDQAWVVLSRIVPEAVVQ